MFHKVQITYQYLNIRFHLENVDFQIVENSKDIATHEQHSFMTAVS